MYSRVLLSVNFLFVLKYYSIIKDLKCFHLQVVFSGKQLSLVPRSFSPPVFDHWWRPERVMCMTSGRHEGAVPNKESWDPSFKILSKTLRLKCLKDSVNTARYSVDSRLTNTRFVSYKDWASPPSCLPSCLADVMHMTLSPRRFCMLQAIKNWRQEQEWG